MNGEAAGTVTDDLVVAALEPLKQAARAIGVSGIDARADNVRRRVETGLLEVAVVGEFKRGKSSLINALIDEQLLPVDVLPLTTVPTVLERGERALEVCLEDGRIEAHDVSEIAEFVTEARNPHNHKRVDHVTLRLHAGLLDDGVRLVDTAGVGSVFEHGTRSTVAYLPRLDAAVLVTSADPPISEGEIAFLDDVLEHAVRLFVVLNKADYLTSDELARTVAFTEDVVRDKVPGWAGPVYPLSARPGVGDPKGLQAFRADLARFLADERAAAVLDSARRTVARAVGELRTSLQLERKAAALPVEDLRRRTDSFMAAVDRLDKDAAQDASLLQTAVGRALGELDAFVARRVPELRRVVDEKTLNTAQAYPDLGPAALLDALQRERAELLRSEAAPDVERAGALALDALGAAVVPVVQRARDRMATSVSIRRPDGRCGTTRREVYQPRDSRACWRATRWNASCRLITCAVYRRSSR